MEYKCFYHKLLHFKEKKYINYKKEIHFHRLIVSPFMQICERNLKHTLFIIHYFYFVVWKPLVVITKAISYVDFNAILKFGSVSSRKISQGESWMCQVTARQTFVMNGLCYQLIQILKQNAADQQLLMKYSNVLLKEVLKMFSKM